MFDPAPVTRHLRAKARSQILVAAVHHLMVFELLSKEPLTIEEIRDHLQLAARPAMVLLPSLCAMELVEFLPDRRIALTESGRFLTKEHPANLTGYVGLEMQDPGVLHLVSWLRQDGPADNTQGLSFVKDEHASSPMDEPESARFFTMALAGRAKHLSPVVAKQMGKGKTHLVDVAGGTGYYSYEWLQANPNATATVVDRPEVLKIAKEILDGYYSSSVKERVRFYPADMLEDELPSGDLLLAASLFHDWPEDVCQQLMTKFSSSLLPGGELWVHDAFLNDALDGPLDVTDYSAILFLVTRGRCYSRAEYRQWFAGAGLVPDPGEWPTLMDYGLISATKPL